jgi:transcriptional regulator with XRE-family HTH domain
MSVGKQLKKAREKKKLSQLDVYEKTNINNKTLSRYENDGAEPDYSTLRTLANLYGVPVSYFFEEYDIDITLDLEELLEDKNVTWGNKPLNKEEKEKALDILKILLDGKKKDTNR